MKANWRTEKEMGRTAEEGSGEKSDTTFGDMLLCKAKEVYGDDFDFVRCVIEHSTEGFVVTFMVDTYTDFPTSGIRMKEILAGEREELRSVIRMVIYDEFKGIGEELVDNIEEDILASLNLKLPAE